MSIRFPFPAMLALTTAIVSLSATAADPARHSKRHGEHGPQPIVLAEANEKILNQAIALDANGDGVIDASEFAAAQEKRRAKRHDADADGKAAISVEEFVAKRQARLAALDTDGDGIVSAEEFRASRHHRHGPRPERGEKPAAR